MFEADSAPRESGGIHEVLESLDRATREFAHRLDELAALGESPIRRNGATPHVAAEAAPTTAVAEPAVVEPEPAVVEPEPAVVEPEPATGYAQAHVGLDQRMAEAEADAQRYLAEAKQRADAMVQSIVTGVEAEADAMRRDAEEGIRARWTQVETEAERFLEDARHAADGIVAKRQNRIDELSGTIVGMAGELTQRMTDAVRIQSQFDTLVVALSEAAGRIATDPATIPRRTESPTRE